MIYKRYYQGLCLKVCREIAGISIAELSQKSGVSVSYINRLENPKGVTDSNFDEKFMSDILILASLLGIDEIQFISLIDGRYDQDNLLRENGMSIGLKNVECLLYTDALTMFGCRYGEAEITQKPKRQRLVLEPERNNNRQGI